MSTYLEDLKRKYPGRPYAGRPRWELLNISKALSLMPWLNTPADVQRLEDVRFELAARRQEGNR